MSTDTNFFDNLKEWSERKLIFLDKYLDASSRILRELYYIDGFAGRGYYGRPNEPQLPGSPIRAAQLAQKIREENRSYTLRCVNVESDRERYEQLVEATKPYDAFTTNLCGPFVSQVDTLLRIVGTKPVLCFLDPFGIDGMDMSAVARLIRRPAPTDVLVRFDVGEARRRDGYWNSSDPSAPKQYDILCRLYGVSDKEALHAALDGPTTEDRHLAAVKYYMRRLGEQYLQRGAAYTSGYRIRAIDGESKYWMIATCGHAKGYVLASNIIYGMDENYRIEAEWYREQQGGQLSMFSLLEPTQDEIFNEKVQQIEAAILATCNGQMSRLDIHAAILHNVWFGRVAGKHITAALKDLAEQGKVKASSKRYGDDKTLFTFR